MCAFRGMSSYSYQVFYPQMIVKLENSTSPDKTGTVLSGSALLQHFIRYPVILWITNNSKIPDFGPWTGPSCRGNLLIFLRVPFLYNWYYSSKSMCIHIIFYFV